MGGGRGSKGGGGGGPLALAGYKGVRAVRPESVASLPQDSRPSVICLNSTSINLHGEVWRLTTGPELTPRGMQ